MQLNDRVAVITGAGRGLGRGLATGFAAQGAAVVCAARTGEEIGEVAAEIRAAGGRALAQPTDVSDLASVEAMVAATLAAWGRLDVLVINAGICPDMGRSIFDSEPQEWVDTVTINLNGAYFCVKAAAPHMRESGGHIILIGSGKGHRAMPDDSAYACSKAGAWMLVRTMAGELASSRICINELIPGPVDTPMNPKGRDQPSAAEWHKQPEDVLPLALFLATQPLSGPSGQSFSLMRRDSQ
ncbi:MAG: SDR family NAD(P)-dependent oxidoreductase [Anaerolineaceae bacterium]|nr:SDR family NAD(P)-dependent oxidoreductase [Anaerolineaceae bacterium]